MNAILIPLVALFSGIGILLVGNGLLGTLLGVRAVSLASLAAGQPLLLFPNPGEFEIFCVASVLVSLGLVPVALTSSSAPAPPRAHPMGLSSLYQVSPLGVAGCFASGLALGAFWSMAPVFCKTLGLSEGDTVIFMVATILGGLFLLWPLGRLSDRLDRRRVLTLACAVSAAASAAMVWTGGGSVPALFGLAIMFGGFTFPIYSIAVVHANDFLEPENLVSASSALLLVYGCGAVLGPLIAGLMMGWMGAFGLYALLSGAMIVTVFFALFRMLVRAPLPVQEQEAVVFVPRTTHVAYELDPRAEPHESE